MLDAVRAKLDRVFGWEPDPARVESVHRQCEQSALSESLSETRRTFVENWRVGFDARLDVMAREIEHRRRSDA